MVFIQFGLNLNEWTNDRKSVPNRYINLWVLDLYTKYINSTRVNRNLSAFWNACMYVGKLWHYIKLYDMWLFVSFGMGSDGRRWEVMGRGGYATERGSSDTQTDKNREDNDIQIEAGGQASRHQKHIQG